MLLKLLSIPLLSLMILQQPPADHSVKHYYVMKTLEELIESSDHIVQTKVVSKRCYINHNYRDYIFTDEHIEITDVYYGDLKPGQVIKRTVLGGTLDGITTFAVGYPYLYVGENAFLFLSNRMDNNVVTNYYIVYSAQGRFRTKFDPVTGNNVIYRQYDMPELEIRENGHIINVGSDNPYPLKDFLVYMNEIINPVSEPDRIPRFFNLGQNYPNPFNPVTQINYHLPLAARVRLIVYNILGQEVEKIVDSELPAGYHSVKWDASKVSSGVYIYRITAGGFTDTKKMLVLK